MQLAPTATVNGAAPQDPPTVEKGAEAASMALTFRSAEPLLDSVMLEGALVVPTSWPPKSSGFGATARTA